MTKLKYMNSDILHSAFGVTKQECLEVRCESNQIILKLQTSSEKLCCSCCGSTNVIRNGSKLRRFRTVPLGARPCSLEMTVQRLTCKDCGAIAQEEIDFAKGKRRHTKLLANMVIDLSRFATIQDIAWFQNMSWDVVRNIQMEYLQENYGNPDLSDVKYISIDEFAVHKGQVYKTIVIDLSTGRIVYVGDGNGKESLDGFWKKLGDKKSRIKAACTDMSSAFTAAVLENLPDASLVIDHFHVRKLMNEKLDTIRRQLMHVEKDVSKRKIIKGTRWMLLKNGSDIFDSKYTNRLENALKLNEPLMKAYYLKEDLREIWNQTSKAEAEKVLDLWIQQAKDAKLQPLLVMANTLKVFRRFILAWYDYPISNGPIEGTNNKIREQYTCCPRFLYKIGVRDY